MSQSRNSVFEIQFTGAERFKGDLRDLGEFVEKVVDGLTGDLHLDSLRVDVPLTTAQLNGMDALAAKVSIRRAIEAALARAKAEGQGSSAAAGSMKGPLASEASSEAGWGWTPLGGGGAAPGGSGDWRPPLALDGAEARWGWAPDPTALRAAQRSAQGAYIARRLPMLAPVYREAEHRTGVPAALVAALHVNESCMGRAPTSLLGPESGFGLDDRHVTTEWGDERLAQYGLGPWERGTGTAKSVQQSAIVAAEHLKRIGAYAGVKVRVGMNANEIAALTTAYMQGIKAGKKALRTGRSWAFDPTDANPHPQHPGGTSRGRRGETIRVAPARKSGLLRWDVLVPMLDEQLDEIPE